MAKLEKEIKILDVDVESMRKKLEEIEAEYKGQKNQKIYVYDIPTLYYRYLEIRELLKSESSIIINANKKKLEVLILEYQDLVGADELSLIEKQFSLKSINEILERSTNEIVSFLENYIVEKSFKKFMINENKWLRLRQSNDKVLLTSKHILEKKNTNFQNVLETEIEVSSLEETNLLLESIGIAKRSYQEKIRYSYKYKSAEIEVDIWPLLKPYMEIECDDENTINELIDLLDVKEKEIVSLNTEQLYKRINIDVHSMSELKF